MMWVAWPASPIFMVGNYAAHAMGVRNTKMLMQKHENTGTIACKYKYKYKCNFLSLTLCHACHAMGVRNMRRWPILTRKTLDMVEWENAFILKLGFSVFCTSSIPSLGNPDVPKCQRGHLVCVGGRHWTWYVALQRLPT